MADRRRLEVIPGITCIWQVSGRSDIPFPEQVKLDMQYIESSSFWVGSADSAQDRSRIIYLGGEPTEPCMLSFLPTAWAGNWSR